MDAATTFAEQHGLPKQSGDIDFATLDALRDGGSGKMEHPCPLCGPDREPPMSERLVLATWEETSGLITYGCARCDAKGYARIGDRQKLRPRKPKPAKPERDISETMAYVEQIWARAEIQLPAIAIAYFRLFRRIDLKAGPPGDLRFDWNCPWQGQVGGLPSLVARYTDAITGAPRGLWRRPVGPDAPKPMSLGPTGGCGRTI